MLIPPDARAPWGFVLILPLFFFVLFVGGCDSEQSGVESDLPDLTMDDTAPADLGPPTGGACGRTLCSDTETCCGFELCVDVTSDPTNCGGCGIGCEATETCQGGVCLCDQAACGSTELCCEFDGEFICADVDRSEVNCGGCGIVCGDGELCTGGRCVCLAQDGVLETCSSGEECCPGDGCRGLETDVRSCGACGVACGAGELCIGGACACGTVVNGGPACATGEACCGEPATCLPVDDPQCDCGGLRCVSGQICCDDAGGPGIPACAHSAIDIGHCGGCGLACGAGERCSSGACTCLPGWSDCDPMADGCETRIDLDVQNCGACGSACAAGELCNAGTCDLTCPVGTTECDSTCANLSGETLNCGACDNACPSGEVCNGGGECALTCLVGATQCSDGCFDLASDRANCGACGAGCASGLVCDGHGQCALSCQHGYSNCAGGCYNLGGHRLHCGSCDVACPSGQVCDGTAQCAPTCAAGFSECGLVCADLTGDPNHCGACGVVCDAGTRCVGGLCKASCPSGQEPCGGICVQSASDPNHCGGCDRSCAVGAGCVQGVCTCAEGYETCSEVCIDTLRDPSHCGACGVTCAAGESCVGGQCQVAGVCAVGLVQCDGLCVDLGSDQEHCGSCGTGCGFNERCVGGTCQCESNWDDCDADNVCETHLLSNEQRCGDCMTSCALGQVCAGGVCECPSELSDCDGNQTCETDIMTSVTSCGSCGAACAAGASCRLGVCVGGGRQTIAETAGGDALLAIGSDGSVYGWGATWLHPTLVGTGFPIDYPVSIGPTFGPTNRAVDIASSSRHVCVLAADGTIRCWSDAVRPEVGCGTCSAFGLDPVTGIDGVVATGIDVATGTEWISGGSFSCAVLATGAVKCWGNNSAGQLGDGSMTTSDAPVDVVGLDGIAASALQVVGGREHACALLSDGTVRCWGAAAAGQLGHGCDPMISSGMAGACDPSAVPVVVDVFDGSSVTAVELAAVHEGTCARDSVGLVHCWGDTVATVALTSPQALSLFDAATPCDQLHGGNGLICGLSDGANAICWGTSGLFHPAGAPSSRAGHEMVGTSLLGEIFGGESGAGRSAGGFWTWGLNESGRLARPAFISQPTPRLTTPGEPRTALEGHGGSFCSIDDTATVECWGPVALNDVSRPTVQPGLPDAVAVASGDQFGCAIATDGVVHCWGTNDRGRAALSLTTSWTAVAAPELNGIVATDITVGDFHGCLIDDAGAVLCWGANDEGQCGIDSSGADVTNPTMVTGIDGVAASASSISAGDTHTCALLTTGALRCWGGNWQGQLGDGTLVDAHEPIDVIGLDGVSATVVEVESGGAHTCAVLSTGAVECWGLSETTSQPVTGLDGTIAALAVSAGSRHSCAVLADGTIHCWGQGDRGQLGNFGAASTTPVQIPDFDGVSLSALDVVASGDTTCVLATSGTTNEVYCLGRNDSGQVGHGAVSSAAPSIVELP